MEDMTHCRVHRERPAGCVCPTCKNRPLCESCKQDHEIGTGHITENFKEVGLALMHQYIQYGMPASELDKGLIKIAKEFNAGLLREIDRLQSSRVQNDERCSKMQKLDSEGRYTELYLYAKSLQVGGANNEHAMGEMNKRLLEMLDRTSKELKKVLSEIAAIQHKLVFEAYQNDEVLVIKSESCTGEVDVISALKPADTSVTTTKLKAIYIDHWYVAGDRVASKLAFLLKTNPISAIYLEGRDISDAGAKEFAQAAFDNQALSAFCITSSRISDTGAKAVAEMVRNSHSLTALYFSGWEISDSGAMEVAEAVKGRPLSVFYLGGLMISDSGAMIVAEAVKSCPLFAFGFASDKISDKGAIAVTKIMKDCPISAFYIGGIKISNSGAAAVAEILSSGGCASTLSAFYLKSLDISDSGAKKVADAMRSCTRLSWYLNSKPLSGETLIYILEGMAGTLRSVNLCIGEVSKEQIDSCLCKVQKSGVARQLKLRLQCCTEAAETVCEKSAAEWNAKLSEFVVVSYVGYLFRDEAILGVLK